VPRRIHASLPPWAFRRTIGSSASQRRADSTRAGSGRSIQAGVAASPSGSAGTFCCGATGAALSPAGAERRELLRCRGFRRRREPQPLALGVQLERHRTGRCDAGTPGIAARVREHAHLQPVVGAEVEG
jgi:hypothetical protein